MHQFRSDVPAIDPGHEDPDHVFSEVRAGFEAAARSAGGVVERTCCIGGQRIRLCFAGTALVGCLTPALAHVIAEDAGQAAAGPELVIRIWEGETTGVEPPTLPAWWWRDSTMRGQPHACHGARLHTAVHANTLSMLDVAAGEALYWVGERAQLPGSEIGSPLLRILHWWMRERGRQLVHGGAVGTREGGVIIAGRGGSGKSTSCLLSLGAGLGYVADDYCLVSTDPSPMVHSLYCSGKVEAADLGRFPFLAHSLVNRDRLSIEKALFMLHDRFADRVSTGFPVRAVLVARVTRGAATRVTPLPAAAGLLALAPSTIFQLPGAGAPALHALGRLTSMVPSFRLDVGTDFARIPTVIRDLLARL